MMRNKQFWSGSIILAGTTFLSYIMGFFRDRLLAQRFGAGATLDAYNAAFIIPDLILNIFVAGALTAAFIPVFSDLVKKGSKDELEETTNSVLNGALSTVTVVGVLVMFFLPLLSPLVAPGFDEATRAMHIQLTRMLLLSPILFAISNTLGSMLLFNKRFFFYGLSPALYNLGIIFGILFIAPHWGIMGVTWGTVIGALLHLALRLGAFRKNNIRYRMGISLSHGMCKIIRLMVPKMFGHPVEQLTFFGFTAIASTLGVGSIAMLNFARNFQSVPVGVIGIAMGLAIFPHLAETSTAKDDAGFRRHLWGATLAVIVVTALVAIFIYILQDWLIGLLLGGGKFDRQTVALTAATLGVFTLSIPTESATHILVRAFYALGNTLTPTVLSIIGMGIAISVAYALAPTYGILALPLGFFSGSILKMLALALLLYRRELKKFFSVTLAQ